LTLRGGQSVRVLHIPVVTEFEHGMRAARRSGEDFVELRSPAEFLTVAHRGSQRSLTSEPLPERTGYPSARFVSVTGNVHQVDDGFLGEGARDNTAREARCRIGHGRDMNDQTASCSDPPAGGNRDVYQPRAPTGKTVQLGGCLVAQQRAFPRVQHGGPQLRLSVYRAGERRVDAPVDLPPPPAPELRDDRACRQTGGECLLSRDHTGLETRQHGKFPGNFVAHGTEYAEQHRQFALLRPASHDHECFVAV
jgi:hypothetical protein